MTTLEWWLLSTCTAAGLATVFRWRALAAAHAVRGAWRRLIPPAPPPPRWRDQSPLPASHFLACGCHFAADSSSCPDRIDVTTVFSGGERRYLHGGPTERGGRPKRIHRRPGRPRGHDGY